ncbi:Questin oxidase [Lasiodiplodia theobromae]|uniref:Questin oxidase n=1 Tax=Lasiodiplodia theobromae TaxID=45133 RepID=A0A5N5D3X9_9PEZI|nr:Questin oxidase [Lasiodiplodia theobromae]
MSTTTKTITAASQVRLSPDHLGIMRGAAAPPESLTLTDQLLQKNHDELHIFFRDMNGHNHLAHNLLTRLALGASPAELRTAFDDDLPTQRPMPSLDADVVLKMQDPDYFHARIGQIAHYTNFLVYFEQQIEQKGWRAVVNEYVFSGSKIAEALLPLMFDGAYHPIIHLGLGVEFAQPSIVAEALAQAAAHDSFDTDYFFQTAEQRAQDPDVDASIDADRSLVDILADFAANDAVRRAGRTEGLIGTKKMQAMLKQAGPELTSLAARFRVTAETLERRTAEMMSFCAYLAGAAQRAGKAAKVDFFFMHCVTSSIFVAVLAGQPWIDVASRVRLVEWKGRLDLVWYAVCGLPELSVERVVGYEGSPSGGDMDWASLFRAVNEQHDDGHVAKFVRALRHGEEVSRPFEQGEGAGAFPVSGDMWLKIARMAYDTTLDLPAPAKWVVMAGMDKAWAQVPKLE